MESLIIGWSWDFPKREILDQEQYNHFFFFNKIAKWMIYSFHTSKNRRKSFDQTLLFLNDIPRSRQLAKSRETISEKFIDIFFFL